MLKRLTLTVTVKDGVFTKTRGFNPDHLYSEKHICWDKFDEVNLINLDGSITESYCNFVNSTRKVINVPLILSGGVSSLKDADNLFELGADRVIINTGLWVEKIEYIGDIADKYGAQSTIASIDFSHNKNSVTAYDWRQNESRETLLPPKLAKIEKSLGEILLQDQNNDGRVYGANVNNIKDVINTLSSNVPIHIGSAGLTKWDHYIQLLKLEEINAVSVSNVHHMSESSIDELRASCRMHGLQIRQT